MSGEVTVECGERLEDGHERGLPGLIARHGCVDGETILGDDASRVEYRNPLGGLELGEALLGSEAQHEPDPVQEPLVRPRIRLSFSEPALEPLPVKGHR
jgi:hypothetical protein